MRRKTRTNKKSKMRKKENMRTNMKVRMSIRLNLEEEQQKMADKGRGGFVCFKIQLQDPT